MDEAEIAMARTFDTVTKYVATHRPQDLGWRGSEWLGRDTVEGLAKIKAGMVLT
ncbi:hypothetical protein [Paracoccus sp. M683]|uniref:hypothetical protein n=1 Tax=Paracoccus sp. M683 TaxID=2594268 RepID=UPI00163DCE02|nr:hypothetical protein [Paracoccus sp. M683]